MNSITLKTTIQEFKTDELDAEGRKLVSLAIEATDNAYAPYSHFHVGAALLLEDGSIVKGANQENASFPVTMCAERSAIFNAQSNKPEQAVKAIAVAARSEAGLLAEPISPCGVCRQAILEIEQRYKQNIKIYLYGIRCVYVLDSIKALLPLSFTEDAMR